MSRRCPRCAEQVQSAAVICRSCGHEFSKPDVWGELDDSLRDIAGKIIAAAAVALLLLFLATWMIEYQRAEASATMIASPPPH